MSFFDSFEEVPTSTTESNSSFFKYQTDETAVNEEEGSTPTCTGSSESEPQVEAAVVVVKENGAHEQFLKPSSYTPTKNSKEGQTLTQTKTSTSSLALLQKKKSMVTTTSLTCKAISATTSTSTSASYFHIFSTTLSWLFSFS